MTDIPEGYELVTPQSDIPEGYELITTPAQRISAYQFPSALQTLSAMRSSPQVQQGGLIARAGLEGVSAPVTMGSDILGLGINKLAGQEIVPSLSNMVSDTLTNAGLPQPNTPLQRLASDVIGGAVGGRSVGSNALSSLVGAVSSGTSGAAREMGASPLTQIVTGLGAGALTGGISGGLQSLLTKPTGAAPAIMNNLETQGIDELSSFPKVTGMLKDEATKQQSKISDLFTQAQKQGQNAYLTGGTLNEFVQNIREQAQNEASPARANLFTNTANNLEKLFSGNTGINAQGMLAYKKPLLNDIEMQRRALTALSQNRDAEGNAAGQLVKQIDNYLQNNIDNVEGNKDAIKTWKDAITARREYGQKFEQPKEITAALEDNSPEAIEQKFIGSGGASLNKQLSTTYKNTLNALPEDQRDQAGFLLRQSIVNRMVKNAAQSSDSAEGISAQRLSNQIRNFRRDNQSMWNNFPTDEQNVLQNMESDLRDKTSGGVVNTIAQHLFKFLGKATNSNLELPRTLKPKTILTTDELLNLTKEKPEGFGPGFKKGIINPAIPAGIETAQYQ